MYYVLHVIHPIVYFSVTHEWGSVSSPVCPAKLDTSIDSKTLTYPETQLSPSPFRFLFKCHLSSSVQMSSMAPSLTQHTLKFITPFRSSSISLHCSYYHLNIHYVWVFFSCMHARCTHLECKLCESMNFDCST